MVELQMEDVTKIYDFGFKKNIVFKDINMNLSSEKIHFLVGPNGSGKSTFIKCILNLTTYKGKIKTSSNKIAYSPEKLLMPDYITVYDFLKTILIAKHETEIDKKIEKYLDTFSIKKYKDTYLIKLSKGTKQKINLIQALLENSDIYIFDEPLSGLDSDSKNVFKKYIYELKKQEKLIIISTHHLTDYRFKNKNIINMEENNV